jgi:tRNA threonylcarbamoyladenosine biosynthesis protein TsaB
MALILQIDTATEHASICLSRNGISLLSMESAEQKNHGSFLQPAIQELMAKYGQKLSDLDAIAVSEGPGSYTGLRVGLASAKGLCYALQKPLITINTLKIIAVSAIKSKGESANGYFFVPMIDARRMEVFTAIYDDTLNIIEAPNAKILDESTFQSILNESQIIFSGSGSPKFQSICRHQNAHFTTVQHDAEDMSTLAFNALKENNFANLAYCEPYYLKSFYSPSQKK